MESPVLDIRNLHIGFETPEGPLEVVRGVDLQIHPGETLAIVGESGSGKTITCLSVMGLLPDAGRISKGSIHFQGRDVADLTPDERRKLSGSKMAMIFQEPMTSLNPLFRVGQHIAEAIRTHEEVSKKEARQRAEELLALVRIPEPSKRLDNYPHELSGGMRQRIMMAMALAGSPDLLIADEPTTALDVTVQAQILDLLAELQARLGMALLFITHDLGVVAGIADRVAVMYAGQVVETGPTRDLYARPRMPYTAGLLQSVPVLSGEHAASRLVAIPGQSPRPGHLPTGCAFAPRCVHVEESCTLGEVMLQDHGAQQVRCRRAGELDLA
jgi:oligopeptide/dipeptide ABC transporter ATP-binding protein